jgi:predicted small integral membrane protein
MPADDCITRNDRFLQAALSLVILETVPVGKRIFKMERINGDEIFIHLDKAAFINKQFQTFTGADAEVVVAFRAYLKIFVYLFFIDDFPAAIALDPQALGNFPLFLSS